MAVYGLAADVSANPDKGVSLYVPGKTKLTPQDVFLGGTGTGVTDDMLGGSTRVFGETSKGTSLAFDAYTKHQTGDNSAYNPNPRPFEGNDCSGSKKCHYCLQRCTSLGLGAGSTNDAKISYGAGTSSKCSW